MRRSSGAAVLVLLLLFCSGCSWTSLKLSSLYPFKEKPAPVCTLSEQSEYEKALLAAQGSGTDLHRARGDGSLVTADGAGQKMSGEQVVHKFVIRNTSKAPLRIEKVISGCGGQVGRYDQTIPSGKEGVITITLNPQGCEESKVRSAIVVTDDPQRPAVTLKARPAKGS
ncbi:MAG: DUF1573 domain-containing protein [Syntrophobacteraceae bacterium]|jgi:hypothetical protein|nr:DUF1573 domain-containing protein [Syntrophobacteraceae bacterium]